MWCRLRHLFGKTQRHLQEVIAKNYQIILTAKTDILEDYKDDHKKNKNKTLPEDQSTCNSKNSQDCAQLR